jgi:hypothetical protein
MWLKALLASALVLAQPAASRSVQVVSAPGSPVRLDSLKLLNTDAEPFVLLYAATNVSDAALEQFTVTVHVFDREGRLKARQVAPGRRALDVKETKYSAMVLDVGKIEPADRLMAGVDQAQRADSETWWRADLRPLAEALAKSGESGKSGGSGR